MVVVAAGSPAVLVQAEVPVHDVALDPVVAPTETSAGVVDNFGPADSHRSIHDHQLLLILYWLL